MAREPFEAVDQHDLGLTRSYTGTHGVNLLFNRQINTVDRQTGLRPYALGEFRYFDTSELTKYPRVADERSETVLRRVPRQCQLHPGGEHLIRRCQPVDAGCAARPG